MPKNQSFNLALNLLSASLEASVESKASPAQIEARRNLLKDLAPDKLAEVAYSSKDKTATPDPLSESSKAVVKTFSSLIIDCINDISVSQLRLKNFPNKLEKSGLPIEEIRLVIDEVMNRSVPAQSVNSIVQYWQQRLSIPPVATAKAPAGEK